MWSHTINALLGAWLTAAPGVLGYTGAMATNDHVVGPLAAAFAIMAIWEVLRSLRRVNLVLGLWLLIAPWMLSAPWQATINAMAVGAVMAGLALIRGRRKTPYAGGWAILWQEDPYGVSDQQ